MRRLLPVTLLCMFAIGASLISACDSKPNDSSVAQPRPILPTAEIIHRSGPSPEDDATPRDTTHFHPQSRYLTGQDRNLFTELGIATKAEVSSRIQKHYQQLFFGGANERVMFDVGEDMAFILSVDSQDIRSEGMSYGMMIAVMMGDQITFNKLWRFSKVFMQRTEGDQRGFFAWQLAASPPFLPKDINAAPDGEEYFVMALFFAHQRWGSGTGFLDYQSEANALLDIMVNKLTRDIGPMFDRQHKQVVFSPASRKNPFTDPSYHLPAFYELWGLWADTQNDYWRDVAQTSRDFFTRASHPETGLFPEYATFSGEPRETPHNARSHHSAYDAHRVIQNMAMDYAWVSGDASLQQLILRLLSFLHQQGLPEEPRQYVAIYSWDGQPLAKNKPVSAIAMNAVGALACDRLCFTENPWIAGFVADLWNTPLPKGQYRYYSGLLHLLGMMHVSGHFKIYGSPGINGNSDSAAETATGPISEAEVKSVERP